MTIFKAYDIRGIYGKELNEDIAYKIGRAIVVFLNAKKIVVGNDIRESSPSLTEFLIKGITDQGCDVYYIGLCSTPIWNFSNSFLNADGSVMVTASHNPKEYNGFKLCRENSIPLSGDTGIKDIENLVNKSIFPDSDVKGKVIEKDTKKEYEKKVLEVVLGSLTEQEKSKRIKAVIDCANSVGVFEMDIIRKMNVDVIPLYDELDGNFPNHEANPLKEETLSDLKKKVVEIGADIGIAFDGDADRVGFIDEKGNMIRMDLITAFISESLLESNKGSTILYDLRSSMIVPEIIRKNSGNPVMCRVGHAFIKQQMREEDALFAGELSGHYYFKDNFTTESSSMAAGMVINVMRKKGKKLSELTKGLFVYYHSGEINSEVSDKELILRKLESEFSDGEISHLDGLRVSYDDWWFNVRPSNTEPVLRLNLEAKTREKMEEMKEKILSIIRGQ